MKKNPDLDPFAFVEKAEAAFSSAIVDTRTWYFICLPLKTNLSPKMLKTDRPYKTGEKKSPLQS